MPLAVWGRSFYSSVGRGSLFLLCFRRRGVIPFVMPPAARGHSFYSSSDSGSFLLLFLRRLRVFNFIPLVDRGRSFCYASGGVVFGLIYSGSSQSAYFWFDRRWLVVLSVGFFSIGAGLS